MKKIFLILALLSTTIFLSCQKEYGYYDHCSLNVNVHLSSVLHDFEEINEGDFTLDDKHAIRVQSFVFDNADGSLVDMQDDIAHQYDESLRFHFEEMPLGEYTIIVATDVLEGASSKSLTPTYWEFTGLSNLSTFAVNALDHLDIMGERLLTLTQDNVSITGRRKRASSSIYAEPVTALICSTFYDIFYWDSHTVGNEHMNRQYNYFDINYPAGCNQVRYLSNRKINKWQYVAAEPDKDTECFVLDELYPNDFAGQGVSNIYGYHAVLPGEYCFRGYGEYQLNGHSKDYPDETRPSTSLYVEEGRQYYVDFDISTWSVTFDGGYINHSTVETQPQSTRCHNDAPHNEARVIRLSPAEGEDHTHKTH